MTELSGDILRIIMPKANVDLWLPHLNHAFERFEINTPSRIAAFLAQAAHESFELNHLEEYLSYSAKRLMVVWPGRFPSLPSARPYERNPRRLANRVYAGRLGNGNEASNDGWRYRGRGIFQLTGRGNYRAAGLALDLPLEMEPTMVSSPKIAALTAGWYWWSRGLNILADDSNDDDDDADFIAISKKINGGTTGIENRKEYWRRARLAIDALSK